MALKEIRTFKDIQDTVIEYAKIDPNSTTERNKVKRKINDYYKRISAKRAYRWSGDTRYITLKGKYTTGTLTATNGSTTLTGASTVWDETTHLGWKIRIGSNSYASKVLRVASNTSMEIDAPYTGDTESSLSYVLYKDEYGMFPDMLNIRKLEIPGLGVDRQPKPSSPEEVSSARIRSQFRSGTPELYTLFGRGYYNAVTWATFKIDYDYWENPFTNLPQDEVLQVYPGTLTADRNAVVRFTRKVPSLNVDSDEPLMPVEYRSSLVYGPLSTHFLIGRDIKTKREWEGEHKAVIREMESDVETIDEELILHVDRRSNRRRSSIVYDDFDLVTDA